MSFLAVQQQLLLLSNTLIFLEGKGGNHPTGYGLGGT